jgi:ATP-dependent Clp protease ATP-binding subunit ClpA
MGLTRMIGSSVYSNNAAHSAPWERCTEPVRKALYFARHEAQRRHEMTITVADLLSGLSVEEGTRAVRIGSLKNNASYLRWLVVLPALPASAAPDSNGHPELDQDAKRALAYAVAEADRDREYWVDSDHLLRGLLRFPNKAHFALLKTEINLNSVRVASRKDREEFLPQENPTWKVVQYLTGKYAALWLPPLVSAACYLYILMQSVSSLSFAR